MDKAFIATEGNLQSSSVIFSSPEALAHTKWREALENPLVSKRVCAIVVVWRCRPFPDRSSGKGLVTWLYRSCSGGIRKWPV